MNYFSNIGANPQINLELFKKPHGNKQPIQIQSNKINDKPRQAKVTPITSLQQNVIYAVEKLEVEGKTVKNEILPVFPIIQYLKDKCLNDITFANFVYKNEKTLSQCLSYTEKEVRKSLNNTNGWLDDQIVYIFAETYYLTDVIEPIEPIVKEQNKNNLQKKKNHNAKRNNPKQLSL